MADLKKLLDSLAIMIQTAFIRTDWKAMLMVHLHQPARPSATHNILAFGHLLLAIKINKWHQRTCLQGTKEQL